MSPYAVLDDGFHGHPKILRGGPIIELLQLRAIAHCNRYLTDGLVETHVIPTLLLGLERLEIDGTPAKDIDWVAQLLSLNLWERHTRGYLVHDFLEFNRARALVHDIKAKKREAGSKGGQASAQARAQASATPSATPSAQAPAPIQAPAPADAPADAQASAQARHVTPRHSTEQDVPLRGFQGGPGGNGHATDDAETPPTDDQIRDLIRTTKARLSLTPTTPDEPAPF